MSDLKIITNNNWRNFLYRYDVPEKVLADQFDRLTFENGLDESDGFIKYRGRHYHVSEFMNCDKIEEFESWHGYSSDSFFSGILIRLSDDGEQYQIATYIS